MVLDFCPGHGLFALYVRAGTLEESASFVVFHHFFIRNFSSASIAFVFASEKEGTKEVFYCERGGVEGEVFAAERTSREFGDAVKTKAVSTFIAKAALLPCVSPGI